MTTLIIKSDTVFRKYILVREEESVPPYKIHAISENAQSLPSTSDAINMVLMLLVTIFRNIGGTVFKVTL